MAPIKFGDGSEVRHGSAYRCKCKEFTCMACLHVNSTAHRIKTGKQARAARFYAENKAKSSEIDIVQVETVWGEFEIGYEPFVRLFGLEIKKGGEICFEIKGVTVIPEKECVVAR